MKLFDRMFGRKATQLTYDQVQPCLTQLVKAGWVEKVGGGGMTRYRRPAREYR